MLAFLKLIGGAKGIGAILLVIAVGGFLWNQKNKLENAELQRDTAIAQRDLVAGERDKAIAAARTNAETIERLEQEKALVNEVLNKLAQDKQANKELAEAREAVIQEQATNPENQAPAAPVLGDLISEVQKDRERRRQ